MSFYKNEFPHMKVLKEEEILFVFFNRPEASNAITYEMIDSFSKIMEFADLDNDISVIVLTGEGKHFCAGGDIKDMQQRRGMFEGDSNELRIRYKNGIQRIPKVMESLSKPVVAMINGSAIGAGLDIACMCDIRVCTEESKFAESFAKLSLVPGDGGTYFLQRIVGFAKAMEMSLTARTYNSSEAFKMNLVNEVSAPTKLKEITLNYAKQISSNPKSVIPMVKKAIQHAYKNDLASSLELLSAFQGIAQRNDDHFAALDKFNQRIKK